jgi:hypothetical protein
MNNTPNKNDTELPMSVAWLGPTSGCWQWIIERLNGDHVFASESSAEAWVLESDEHVLICAVESRCDPLPLLNHLVAESDASATIDETKKKKRKRASIRGSQILYVLGEAWPGHRRTQPLPESLATFYWYELYDRLLPSLNRDILSLENSIETRGRRVERWLGYSQQIQPTPSGLALVLCDSTTDADLWQDSLSSIVTSVVVADAAHACRLRLEADLVLIDFEETPRNRSNSQNPQGDRGSRLQRIVDQLAWTRTRFPDAMTVVADSFPRWADWSRLDQGGADLLIPKPFNSFGISWALDCWRTTAMDSA